MSACQWTPLRDATLRRLREAGAGWAQIGAAFAVSPAIARERGRRIGAVFAPPPRAATPAGAEDADPGRDPLPAGDPAAWALLTDGTLLAGTPWPGYAAAAPEGRAVLAEAA